MRTIQTSSTLKNMTLVQLFHAYALERPTQVAYTFLRYSEAGNESLTYGELDIQARLIGTHLRTQGAEGKPVLLLFSSGLEYISAYFGCLYAGAIAVPAYVPHSARDLPRIEAIILDTQADIALTTKDEFAKMLRLLKKAPDLARLTWIPTDTLERSKLEAWQPPNITGKTLAFLQYTSGSTTTPRGVMVSHDNIMQNLAMLHAYWKVDETAHPIGVYWLPLFHDMGLIMGMLSPLYSGYPVYFMSPTDFLQRPLRWLQAISEYRGVFSSAPNFAYELCLRRIAAEDLGTLDLRSWEGAGNGAEPVRNDTIERFTRYFSPCGFSQTAFRPAYGLAEATLVVTSGYKAELVYRQTIDKQRLEEGYVETVSAPEQQTRLLVGCGRPAPTQQVMIVDPTTLQRCTHSQVGEIWVAGPSVAQGYWKRPAETASIFQAYLATGEGPFLRTGDLGVFQDENLFITGRSKDLIILNGRNLYPQDIELSVEQAHPAIRADHCVAFSCEEEGEEQLIILAEINHRYRPQAASADEVVFSALDVQEIIQCVQRAVSNQHAVRTQHVLLLKLGGIPKTSSGKVQRRACHKAFLQGTLKTWNGLVPDQV